ncbi:MAG: hypothetical protein BGO01_03220 [Armatimonadetes bacterium 55-13]|nr:MAG: hypothetical protein BGO01_03220 [Armatimonadetes bacterium 55-13]
MRSLLIVLSIALGSTARISNAQVYSPPKWIQAKWTESSKPFLAIRIELDGLKYGPKRDPDRVKELFKLHVTPIKWKLTNPSLKMGVVDLYWATALAAYFPGLVDYDIAVTLEKREIPPSYEFVRVAFVAYTQEASYRGAQTGLADRLLKQSPEDPLIETAFVNMVGLVRKPDLALLDRSLMIAEKLEKTYPQRADIFRPLLMKAYLLHGNCQKKACIQRALDYILKLSKDPGLSDEQRERYLVLHRYYTSQIKRSKFKG